MSSDIPHDMSTLHPRNSMARFCHKHRLPTPHETLKRPPNYRKETSFLFGHVRRLVHLHMPPSDSVLTATLVSGQEVAGAALPVGLIACGSHSWQRTRECLPRSHGGLRRTGGCGWLDYPATVQKNAQINL